MGKFIKSKIETTCAQTKKKIKEGDDIYYCPGRGSYHPESPLYKREMAEVRKSNLQFNSGR